MYKWFFPTENAYLFDKLLSHVGEDKNRQWRWIWNWIRQEQHWRQFWYWESYDEDVNKAIDTDDVVLEEEGAQSTDDVNGDAPEEK
jgi:hypothetical protein